MKKFNTLNESNVKLARIDKRLYISTMTDNKYLDGFLKSVMYIFEDLESKGVPKDEIIKYLNNMLNNSFIAFGYVK